MTKKQKIRIREHMNTLERIAFREWLRQPKKTSPLHEIQTAVKPLRETRQLRLEELSQLEYWLHVLETLIDGTGKPFSRMKTEIAELREVLQHEQKTAGRD